MLIFPCPSCPLEQRQAWPQDNQHVTIQAGEIPRVDRLFESPIVHKTLPEAPILPDPSEGGRTTARSGTTTRMSITTSAATASQDDDRDIRTTGSTREALGRAGTTARSE